MCNDVFLGKTATGIYLDTWEVGKPFVQTA